MPPHIAYIRYDVVRIPSPSQSRLADGWMCVLPRLEFKVKKEGWGGGGTRLLLFQRGPGDLAQVKAAGKTLSVTVGDGLPKTSSKLLFGL